MMRMLSPFVVLAALVLVAVPFASADDPKKDDPKKEGTHEGLVVKAGNNQLTMTDMAGKNEHTHAVADTATIMCDGKVCKLEELEKGVTVKVTLERKEDKMVATKIEGTKEKKTPPGK
jgi:hypothetical protein